MVLHCEEGKPANDEGDNDYCHRSCGLQKRSGHWSTEVVHRHKHVVELVAFYFQLMRTPHRNTFCSFDLFLLSEALLSPTCLKVHVETSEMSKISTNNHIEFQNVTLSWLDVSSSSSCDGRSRSCN